MTEEVNRRTFLQPAINGAADYLQVLDGETRQIERDNPVLRTSAFQALRMAQSYTKRPWVLGSYCERHVLTDRARFKVKVTPLVSVTKLVIKGSSSENDEELTEGEDYEIQRDEIVLLDTFTVDSFTRGFDFDEFREEVFEIDYRGGIAKSDLNEQLNEALIVQTAANFKRAPTVGLRSITGGSQTGTITQSEEAGNTGGLVHTVEQILWPLTYEGEAFDC